MRIANKVRGARPTILAANALAETYLASGQWLDALEYTQEALDEAKRTRRLRELSHIHEIRSRAFLRKEEARRAEGAGTDADEALRQAFTEANLALEVSRGADCVPEQVAAHLSLARCYFRERNAAEAERQARSARELTAAGAIGLSTLLGADAEMIPALLRSQDIDLPRLFAGRAMLLPGMEWQAGLIEGQARAQQFGPADGFAAIRDAAVAVNKLVESLTLSEAVEFRRTHPAIETLFASLRQFAVTDAARDETRKVLGDAPWIARESDAASLLRIGK
jgi:tetratricopeptide (TPR) repeat protein